MSEHFAIEDVTVVKETPKAILVRIDEETRWIPKAAVCDESEVYSLKNGGPGTLVIEAWLAEREGLT